MIRNVKERAGPWFRAERLVAKKHVESEIVAEKTILKAVIACSEQTSRRRMKA